METQNQPVPVPTPAPTPVPVPPPVPAPAPTPVQGGHLAGPSELLAQSWSLFKANWKILVLMVIAPLLITALGRLFAGDGLALSPVLGGLLIFIAGILTVVMQVALTDTVKQLSGGSTGLSVKTQYRFGLKLFWPLVWVIILQILIVIGSSIALIIPAIVMSVYTSVYTLALIVDGKRGWNAFAESYALVKGRWWGVLGRLLAIGLISVACYLVGVGLSFVIEILAGIPLKSSGAEALSAVVSDLVGIFVWPLSAVYTYKLYESLKASRLPGVEVKVFKRWVTAFIVVSIITPLIVLAVGLPIFLSSLKAPEALPEVHQVIDSL